MTPSWLKFDDRYAAVFLSKSPDALDRLQLFQQTTNVSVLAYQSPSYAFCLVIGDKHPEPVVTWLRLAHETVSGSSFLVGIVNTKRVNAPKAEAWLFRARLKDMKDESLRSLLEEGLHFSFVNPFSSELYILSTSFTGPDILRLHPDLGAPITDLEFKRETKYRYERKQSTSLYDPIEAQIRETLNSSSQALQQQIDDLKRVWRSNLAQEPPVELLQAENELQEEVHDLRMRFAEEMKPGSPRRVYMVEIDHLAQWMREVSGRCAWLVTHLEAYAGLRDPWSSQINYKTFVDRMLLHAARNYMLELSERSGNDQNVDFIPIYAKSFSLYLYVVPLLSRDFLEGKDFKTSLDRIKKSTLLVSIPHEFKHRLGALPALAHEISHFLVVENPKVIEPFVKIAREVLFKEPAGFKWKTLSDAITATIASEPRFDLRSGVSEEEMHFELLRVIVSWSREFVADLIAVQLAGPAYVYTLSRFATGYLREFVGDTRPSQTHPLFRYRIVVCLEFLNYLGFRVPFVSKYLDMMPGAFPKEVGEQFGRVVKRPYTPTDHEISIGRIKTLLGEGRKVDGSPSMVLNALWDAVMKKDIYVNEIAALSSMQSQEDPDT